MTFKNPSPVFGFLKLGLFVSLLLMKAKTKQKKKASHFSQKENMTYCKIPYLI